MQKTILPVNPAGAETCLQLAQTGSWFVLAASRGGKIPALCKDEQNVMPVKLDITKPLNIASFAYKLDEAGVGVSLLVNNAGVALDRMAKIVGGLPFKRVPEVLQFADRRRLGHLRLLGHLERGLKRGDSEALFIVGLRFRRHVLVQLLHPSLGSVQGLVGSGTRRAVLL